MLEAQQQHSAAAQEEAMRQKGRLAILRSQISQMRDEADRLKVGLGQQDGRLLGIEREYKQLKGENKQLQREIDERDGLLQQKDGVIKALKQRAEAQHRLKDIKTFKIQELGKQVAPRQALLGDMKEQLSLLEARSAALVKQQESVLSFLGGRETGAKALQARLKQAALALTRESKRVEALMDGIVEIVKTRDKKEWLSALRQVAATIDGRELVVDDLEERLRNKQEIARHNAFLSRELEADRTYAGRVDSRSKAKIEALILENTRMLDEESRTRQRIRAASYTIQERRASLGIAKAERRRDRERERRLLARGPSLGPIAPIEHGASGAGGGSVSNSAAGPTFSAVQSP